MRKILNYFIISITSVICSLKFFFSFILNLRFFQFCIHHVLSLLQVLKRNKSKVNAFKLFFFISINILLMFFFFDIIKNNNYLLNNNEILTNIQMLIQPILLKLNIEINVNIQQFLIITIIVIIINLILWYLNKILSFILLSFLTKYSYNSYTKYLNQEKVEGVKENFNYYGLNFQQLTDIDKEQLFQEYLKNKSITDGSAIEHLKNQMINIQCTNKKEFFLNMDIEFIEYKQRLLAKLIINHENQLNQIQKASFWDHLDTDTMLKIGAFLLLIGLGIGGYYWYKNSNNNNNNSNNNNIINDNNDNNDNNNNNIEIEGNQLILDDVKLKLSKDLLNEAKQDILNELNELKELKSEVKLSKDLLNESKQGILNEAKHAEDILKELKSEAKHAEDILKESKQDILNELKEQIKPTMVFDPVQAADILQHLKDVKSELNITQDMLVNIIKEKKVEPSSITIEQPSSITMLDNINEVSDTASTVSLILKYLAGDDTSVGKNRIARTTIMDWLNAKLVPHILDDVEVKSFDDDKLLFNVTTKPISTNFDEKDFPITAHNSEFRYTPEHPINLKKD